MSKAEEVLRNLLSEQERTSLFTLTLERDRLYGALIQAGLATPVITANEFVLAPGATSTIVQLVPAASAYLFMGSADFYSSLPWWVSYSMWWDTTAPATPNATATRMPAHLSLDFSGIAAVRAYIVHQMTNLHATQTAYVMVMNMMLLVTNETWDMIRKVYLDAIVADVRKQALKISGLPR